MIEKRRQEMQPLGLAERIKFSCHIHLLQIHETCQLVMMQVKPEIYEPL